MPEIKANILTGQVAIITGAGSGIGAAIARKLAALGATAVLCGRKRTPLETTATAITEAGGRAEIAECDVTDLRSVEAVANQVDHGFGRADILVNNAGAGGFGRRPVSSSNTLMVEPSTISSPMTSPPRLRPPVSARVNLPM